MPLPIPIVLLHPEIPHNTGAIGRLCVDLDCPLHLVRPLGFALTSSWVKRAGMDYWKHVDLHLHDNWDAFLRNAKPVRLHFASTRGTRSLYDCPFAAGDSIIFGNESAGLPAEFYTRYAADLFRIPMPGRHARSLNLANAASVAAYEALRQLAGGGNGCACHCHCECSISAYSKTTLAPAIAAHRGRFARPEGLRWLEKR